MGATIKRHIIRSLAYAPKLDAMRNNQVQLVTSAGIICGDLVTKDDSGLETWVPQLATNCCKDMPEPEGNDGFLPLKNVQIINGDVISNFKSLVVFYDQIIGVSLGNLERS